MEKIFTPKNKKLMILIAVISFVTALIECIYFYKYTSATLSPSVIETGVNIPKTFDIIDIELTFNAHRTETIIAAWEKSGVIENAKKSISIDWFFIISYSLLLFSLTLLTAGLHTGMLRITGYYLAFTAFIAGLADTIENLFLLSFITTISPLSEPAVILESTISLIKWAIIAILVIYILVAFFVFVFKWTIKPKD